MRLRAVKNAKNTLFARRNELICFLNVRAHLPEEVIEHEPCGGVRVRAANSSICYPSVLLQVHREEHAYFQNEIPVAVNAGELGDR